MEAHDGMTKKEFLALLKLAQDGDVKAQYETGLALRNGWGTEWNGAEAFKWVKKAAENGDAQAMCTLGHMYFMGDCIERNYDEAKAWFTSSVTQGYIQCTVCVNELYVAEAVEAGNLKEAKSQLELRKKMWDMPLSDKRIVFRIVEVFFNKLQDRIHKLLPHDIVPQHTRESLNRDKNGNLWYHIKTGNENVIAAFFEYCRNAEPPFLALAFYASKHGANKERMDQVLQKFQGEYNFKDEGKDFGFGVLVEMTDDSFLEEKYISELAEQAVKVYEAIDRAQKALAGEKAV